MKFLTVLCLVLPLSMWAANRPVNRSFVGRSEVIAPHAMAATSQPLATQVALDLLKQGGTAVDAAIGANALMGLVEPTGNGMGGDLFAIVWDAKSARLHGLNGSGRSPYSLTLDHLKSLNLTNIPQDGPLPVSVPGCVDGWFTLHQRFGRLTMDKVLAAAARYARDGFPVSEVIGEDWRQSAEKLVKWPGFKETYLPNGKAPKTGEIFRNPGLARTLELLATGGRDAFYKGPIAATIAAYMKEQGGFLTEKDLADHRSEWIEPVSVNYRGFDIWELPPNGQGIAALQMLNILEGYDIAAMGFGSAEYLHHFIEAKKLAFEDRAKFYADPGFNSIPVRQLISKEYAVERRKLINTGRAAARYDAGNPAVQEGDTIYLTVADAEGNMVSLIQSNYRGFGSGMTPPGLGFVLQNRGELFDLSPGRFNTYAPHKLPFHTIIPAFITRKGQPFMSFGVMGGGMQPQGHVQIVINIVDFGMNLQEAGDAPRVQHTGSSEPTGEKMEGGGEVHLEYGFGEEVERTLLKRGHRISRAAAGSFGGYQAIKKEGAVYYGASESRKDGQAAGY